MAKKINSTLNASTLDILNVIRANAPLEYQQDVPVADSIDNIPAVGEAIYGSPAHTNIFVNALINRIALVQIKNATFNNPYRDLKKGYLEFGETVENIFVEIARVRTLNAEKAPAREFARTIPDVRSVFHVINWRVQYPLTVSEDDLKTAFTSADGVQSLITRLIDSIYKAAEYDEYLLFKYMLIKAVSHGKIKTVKLGDSMQDAAVNFRGYSNMMTFLRPDFNEAGVKNDTPKSRQQIFMDSLYNADYDVNVLAAAFNMDRADFMGRLRLIDDFSTFDNDRWATIRQECDGMVEDVSEAELATMKNIKAILIDEDWFQIYDHHTRMGTTPVNSGEYWNYFYNVKKDVSHSPFANAIAFTTQEIAAPVNVTVEVVGKDTAELGTVISLSAQDDTTSGVNTSAVFVQTEEAVNAGVAVHKYGTYIFPANGDSVAVEVALGGVTYTNTTTKLATSANVGSTIVLTKNV